MMKIILFSLLLFIVNLNGRFTSIVIAIGADKTGKEKDKVDLAEQISKNSDDSKLIFSNTLEKSAVFFEETDTQELLLPSQSVVGDPPFIDNFQVSSELTTTAEAVVFPSADSAVELQNRVKNQFQNEKTNDSNQFFTSFESEKEEYVVHAEPKVQVQPITEETLKAEVNESEPVPKSSQEEPKKTAPQHEDIPSFSEWTQKQLAEAEKKKTDQNETSERVTKTRGKYRNKNYASPDCGAKIVAANPESQSSSAVLSSLKDEYMLNYCTNRIWFVVELCEAIQAKQLDLANFELFSSSPKHFSVSLSHRFPTRDWSNVGKFTAQDSRDVQTFNLQPHLFGKFVKVELHSHYGRELFCPISWVGVYGTSEYEVLAKEDERHSLPDEDDPYEEYLFVGHRRDSPKNLFSSATDAVLSIVKKATAPFMKTENKESMEKLADSKSALCISPRYITVCNNCSQTFYDEVFSILSCQHFELVKLLGNSFVKLTLINSETCTRFGLDFNSLRTGAPFPCNYAENPKQEVTYLTVMLKNSVVSALCNVLAVLENKVVVNATMGNDQTLRNLTERTKSCEVNLSKSEATVTVKPSTSCEVHCPTQSSYPPTMTSIFTDIFKSTEQFTKKIEPTKTLTEDEVKNLPPSDLSSETHSKIMEEKSTDLLSTSYVLSTATLTHRKERSEVESSTQTEQKLSFVEIKPEVEKETENKTGNGTNNEPTLESIISDINAIEKAAELPSTSVVSSTSNLPTESIFLRLANRIKNLEINMSLSSTYLEELSKRYRVQLELLSKTLNLTIQKMEEQSKADEEREKKREKEIIFLRMQLANLTRDVSILLREKNSWRPKASSISQHMLFISVEILLVWTVFSYWKGYKSNKNSTERLITVKKTTKKSRRRNSLEGVKGHETPRRKIRRPSDEALEIALSRSHRDDIFKIDKKRRRRKKESRCSINVIQLKRKKSEEVPPDIEAVESKPSFVSEEIQVPEFIPNIEIEITNRFAAISSPSDNSSSIGKAFQSLSSSPIFMKTALAARNSRLKLSSDKESSQEQSVAMEQEGTKKERKGSNGLKNLSKSSVTESFRLKLPVEWQRLQKGSGTLHNKILVIRRPILPFERTLQTFPERRDEEIQTQLFSPSEN